MKVTRFGIMLTAAALATLALSSCSKVTELREAASDVAEKVVTSGTEKINDAVSGNLLTAEGMDHALGAISQKVGANPMQVVEVIISPSALSVQAVDPNAPNELNQWSYTAGTVGPSRPVDYDDDTEALQQNLFAIGDVPTSAIAAAIDAAVPASDIKDGAVQSVSVKRNLPFDDNVIIFVNVTSDRSSKQVRADSTGQVTQVV
jgi:hypothetical protein